MHARQALFEAICLADAIIKGFFRLICTTAQRFGNVRQLPRMALARVAFLAHAVMMLISRAVDEE